MSYVIDIKYKFERMWDHGLCVINLTNYFYVDNLDEPKDVPLETI